MKQRPLGKTGLSVSEIGFGGWAIGGSKHGNSYGHTDDDVSRAAILCALESGITVFDTADIYGQGHSETLIGEVTSAWTEAPPLIVTKGGINFYRPDGTLEHDWTPFALAHAVEHSMARLRRSTLDVFLLMNPPVRELEELRVWETLAALKRGGKIVHAGISVADPEDGVWLIENDAPVDIIEVAFSIFYQGPIVTLLPLAEERGIGILAREPLANGFLAARYPVGATFQAGDIRAALPTEYVDAMASTAAELSFLAAGTGRTPAQAAIRFVLDHTAVSSVVVGAKTPAQVVENAGAANCAPIDTRERERIQRIFDQ